MNSRAAEQTLHPQRNRYVGNWAAEDTEIVRACPVCASTRRLSLHTGVEDTVFRCAPGQWDLQTCGECGVAYLDPRPTAASIGRAYASYYTHAATELPEGGAIPKGYLARLRRSLRNGYLARQYGAAETPASRWGWLAMQAMRPRKTVIDRQNRNLPKLPEAGGKVLDIGCGNGIFLKRARQIGWDAWGVEPDANASARLNDPQVLQGSLPCIPLPDESFDYITLSHVIEHLHDPVAALEEIHRLLKPGGKVWIATPNIESLGHRVFGTGWIGIQSPTHLVLFSRKAIRRALRQAGLERVEFMPMRAQARVFFGMSHWLRVGRNPFTERAALPTGLRFTCALADGIATVIPWLREEIVVVAQKSEARKRARGEERHEF